MKHSILIALAALFIIAGCAKDGVQTNQPLQNQVADSRDNGVAICHLNGQGEFQLIHVNANAVQAHLDHGDQLAEADADGDGYFAPSACGSGDDCDDTNADVNPGAEEICGNGIDDNCDAATDDNCCIGNTCFDAAALPFLAAYSYAYYDTDVNDCEGTGGENVLLFVNFEGTEFIIIVGDLLGEPAIAVFTPEDGFVCVVAGEDLTEEMYSCMMAAMRTAIASADPQIPNYCDLFRPGSRNAPSKLFDNKDSLREKMKAPPVPSKLWEKLNNR